MRLLDFLYINEFTFNIYNIAIEVNSFRVNIPYALPLSCLSCSKASLLQSLDFPYPLYHLKQPLSFELLPPFSSFPEIRIDHFRLAIT